MKGIAKSVLPRMYYDTLELKVDSGEFKAACEDGEVYGKIIVADLQYVYAELGKEIKYISRRIDNEKTRYRKFMNCHAFFANTQEKVDNGDFSKDVSGIKIIIFC